MRFAFTIVASLIGMWQSRPSAAHSDQTPQCAIDTVWRFAEPSAARVARLVPEYAGSYATPESLTFFLTDTTASERVRDAFRTQLSSNWGRDVLPRARFVVVRYSYRQLQSWLECVITGARPGDWRMAGVDELRNQARLGSAGAAAFDRLKQLIVDLGLPRDAIDIQLMPPPG